MRELIGSDNVGSRDQEAADKRGTDERYSIMSTNMQAYQYTQK